MSQVEIEAVGNRLTSGKDGENEQEETKGAGRVGWQEVG